MFSFIGDVSSVGCYGFLSSDNLNIESNLVMEALLDAYCIVHKKLKYKICFYMHVEIEIIIKVI